MWLALFTIVAHAEPFEVLYNGPVLQAGQSAIVGSAKAPLRASPLEESSILRELPVGAVVRVVGMNELESLPQSFTNETFGETYDRETHWWIVEYSEATPAPIVGYMLSADLATQTFENDFNGDGRYESLLVHYDQDGTLAVRWFDSNTSPGDDGSRPSGEVSLGAPHDFGGLLQLAQVEMLPPEVAGMPLLKVTVPGSEMCGGFTTTTWVSMGDQLSATLKTISGGDAPVFTSGEVAFYPKKRTAVLTITNGEYMNDGSEENDVTTQQWTFSNGVWTKKSEKTKHVIIPAQ